jgi:pimeloyl-ACP methyl ester carboxylesterase
MNLHQIRALTGIFLVAAAAHALSAKAQPTFQDRQAFVEDHDVHYRIAGHGPVLLMLHGMTLTGEQWLPIARQLTQSYTVVVADLPGHGASSPFAGKFRFGETAKAMHALLDRLGAKRAYGIGHSAGAITLLHMAAQRPQRFEALALVDGPYRFGEQARKVAAADRWEALDEATREWYRTMHPGGIAQAKRIYRQYNGLVNNHEQVPLQALAALPARTLLVWGDRDPFFPVDLPLEMVRAMPRAQLWVIPGQGHTPLWASMGGSPEAARAFPRRVLEFFAGGASS